MEAEDPPFFISLPEVFHLQILLILLWDADRFVLVRGIQPLVKPSSARSQVELGLAISASSSASLVAQAAVTPHYLQHLQDSPQQQDSSSSHTCNQLSAESAETADGVGPATYLHNLSLWEGHHLATVVPTKINNGIS